MPKDAQMLEETLKTQVRDRYFSKFKMSQIGAIDFVISKDNLKGGNLDLFDDFEQCFLWAEAKRGVDHDICKSFVQLILTIGKDKTYEKKLPPIFLGAFDAEKIAFVDYSSIQSVFFKNDFNWNVRPSDYSTDEFREVEELIRDELAESSLIFYYERQDAELKDFIKSNFVLGGHHVRQIEVTKNNFISVYYKWLQQVKPTIGVPWDMAKKAGLIDSDFYLADLLSRDNETLKDALFVLLRTDYYEFDRNIDEFGLEAVRRAAFTDRQAAHKSFWNIYKRPPRKDFWQYIIDRRDLLVPQDIRERKGSYFTPQIWVEKSQEYLMRELGENWQDDCFIWDCCAGTGNLLNGLANKYNIWASTIDQADVDVMKDRIRNGANLLEAHVFKFDFLNDSFEDLPAGLKDIINSEEKRKRLVIYINPPYAEAATKRTVSGSGENKTDVAVSTSIYKRYEPAIKLAARELSALFLYRINREIPGCIIANFSKLKILQGPAFAAFRQRFSYKLKSLFIVEGNTFDNVKGSFPIGFHIWTPAPHFDFDRISADVFNKDGELVGKKALQNYDGIPTITDWIVSTRRRESALNLGFLYAVGCDFQHQNQIFIVNKKEQLPHPRGTTVTDANLLDCSVFVAARKAIKPTWLNDRDLFVAPVQEMDDDLAFKGDCLVYTLFSNCNNIKSSNGVNHWIPFKEAEIDTRDTMESHFMADFIKTLPLSNLAQDAMQAARELWRYYHSMPNSNPNASLYDIKEYFQGRNADGKLNAASNDQKYLELLGALKEKHKALARDIVPKVYEYGFLVKA